MTQSALWIAQASTAGEPLPRQAQAEKQASQRQPGSRGFTALQQLGAGLGSGLPDLTAALDQCIDAKTSVVLDRASPRLGQVRQQRRDNRRLLQEEMDGWAQRLQQQGVSELRQVPPLFPLQSSWTCPLCLISACSLHALNLLVIRTLTAMYVLRHHSRHGCLSCNTCLDHLRVFILHLYQMLRCICQLKGNAWMHRSMRLHF